MDKKISIIIPAYNVAGFLEKCLESVCGQTLREIEIILINDGSVDGTTEICKKWAEKESRIKLINQTKRGVAESRNTGLSMASAPYIGFVDSDDWIEPDMYEKMYYMIREQKADICICGIIREYPAKHVYEIYGPGLSVTDKKKALYELLKNKRIQSYCWDKLFHRSLLENISFPPGKIMEDYAVMPEIFECAEKIAIIGLPLYHYRQHPASILGKISPEREVIFFEVLQKRSDFVRKNPLLTKKQKTEIGLKIRKKMILALRTLERTTLPQEYRKEKESMRNITGKNLKRKLRSIFVLRILSSLGLYRELK